MTVESTITCPNCRTAKETMPTDACQFFYDCTGCGTLLKPKTQNGVAARALLLEITREPDSDYVFPGVSGKGYYQGTKRVWSQAIKKANLSGVTPHTLRHTMGSIAVSTGEALAMTGAILGHANARSTSLYAHTQNDPARLAADRVSSRLSAALEGLSGG